MLHKAFNHQGSNTLQDRCQHHTATGRQCRSKLTSLHATLCPRHGAAQRLDSTDLSALLSASLSEKKSAADIHAHLWNLSLALQQGRISPRRAAVLAYINSLLLRTLPAIDKQSHPVDRQIIVDMPRPDYTRLNHDARQAPSETPSYPTPHSSSPKLYGFHPAVIPPPAAAISAAPGKLAPHSSESRQTTEPAQNGAGCAGMERPGPGAIATATATAIAGRGGMNMGVRSARNLTATFAWDSVKEVSP
jgi:hypothetical protein